MAELPPPPEGIVLAHFIVSDDVERSRRFYTEVLGGRLAFSGDVTYVALSNSWIIINVGGGPTDDKPAVTLETPPDPDRVSSFLNIRVTDIEAVYAEWSARGANFLTPPKQHQYETRCYIRDPDGHLIEVGQTTDPDGDWVPAHWPSSTTAASPRDCADPLHRLRRRRALPAVLYRSTRRQGRLLRKAVRRADQCRTIQQLHRQQRGRWTDRRQAGGDPGDAALIPTGSAASSTSGSKTSRPCTPNGAPGARIS